MKKSSFYLYPWTYIPLRVCLASCPCAEEIYENFSQGYKKEDYFTKTKIFEMDIRHMHALKVQADGTAKIF